MLIQSMPRQASIELLERAKIGRLACAQGGQPYITPILLAYDTDWIYSFSTLGQKIHWMRANPLVCVEVDEMISQERWSTVIVFGRYEELPDTPSHEMHRKHAYDLLHRRAAWWEPGYVRTIVDGKERPLEPLYFRIYVEKISGHQGLPNPESR